jgi:hypothetical protein
MATESYIKVVVIKIDDFESEIIDERNFGLTNIIEKEDFINSYQDDNIVCLERVVK